MSRSVTAALIAGALGVALFGQAALAQQPTALTARVVAVGIPGASAVAQVGVFLPGGPIHDNATFAAFTQPGKVIDPKRVLVTSRSNFGAPLALADAPEGAALSLDPDGPTLVIPGNFATAGNQSGAADGRIQLFAAQSPAFLNSVRTPGAASANQPTVTNPLGISINNGFGRFWFSNAPRGGQGPGTESIADPTGEPLANAPSKLLGGVFVSDITGRTQQIIPGALKTGAIASALLGMSPDGGKRAVFAVLTTDGAIAQAHTELALDGLAPAGTVNPVVLGAADDAMVTRAGMLFNWVPNRILYVTEPAKNDILVLNLSSDDKVFRVTSSNRLASSGLNVPVDMAPAVPEVGNPGFASNTTLSGNSDIYVANRGDGTIVRIKQDGTVVGTRKITLPDGTMVGPGRLNGIAVSSDAQKIWVTLTGAISNYPSAPGVLLEVPAFGPGRAASLGGQHFAAADVDDAALVAHGGALFATAFTPAQGLGPLYNATSCVKCHGSPTVGGMGTDGGLGVVERVGTFDGRIFDPMVGKGGPVARAHSIAELGVTCDLAPGAPAKANLISLRNAPPLYGVGLIDAIPDDVILAGVHPKGGVDGKANIVRDGEGHDRVGRFGWKADTPSLGQFVADAFRNELGITNPLAPTDLVDASSCGKSASALDDDGTIIGAVTAYLASLPRPAAARSAEEAGNALFLASGCDACHTPTLASSKGDVPLYSDLLLHDMGPSLADGVVQGAANGTQWRTTPLWGISLRTRFLHDGRSTSVRDAILAHDGEGASASKAFRQLDTGTQHTLLSFLAEL